MLIPSNCKNEKKWGKTKPLPSSKLRREPHIFAPFLHDASHLVINKSLVCFLESVGLKIVNRLEKWEIHYVFLIEKIIVTNVYDFFRKLDHKILFSSYGSF